MAERKQDAWFVSVSYRNELGRETFSRRGILDLPHPMTSFEAADYAVRVEVESLAPFASVDSPAVPREVHAMTWSKRKAGRDSGRYQECGALAEYDVDMGVFMRCTPWVGDGERIEMQSSGGAVIHALDWN